MKNLNNDEVPIECILKHVIQENEKLKKEVSYLKDQLNRKEDAIKAFKKWQAKVAEYKIEYWMNEGKKLMVKNYDDEFSSLECGIAYYDTLYNRHVKKVHKCAEMIRGIQERYNELYETKIFKR